MDEKTKKTVGTVIGIGAVVGIGVVGFHYYRKSKGFDGIEKLRFPKLLKSNWKNIDREHEELDEYAEDELNKTLDHPLRTKTPLRKRFAVYDSKGIYGNKAVDRRFKRLETVGDPKAIREKGRLRVSGNIYRKDTPSGYNNNNHRNPNFSDLIIP